MNRTAIILYFLLLGCSLFSSKFVLTTIGFRYPTVFQGWQTLVGFLLYRMLHSAGLVKINKMDRPGLISLFPYFVFFTSGILTGSMALSQVPVISFISVAGCVQVFAFVLTDSESRRKLLGGKTGSRLRSIACTAVLLANLALLLLEHHSSDGYFWLEMHCLCSLGLVAYGRISDARFTSIDRQYYCYLFSLVVLLPASFYLNEAFEALNFHALYQLMFLGGSLVCAISGVGVSFCQSRLRNNKKFGPMHHGGLAFVAVLSLLVFEVDFLTWWSVPLSLISVLGLVAVPTHILPEESGEEDDLKTGRITSVELLSSV